VPYKESILPFLSSLTPEAQAIGAVNAIKPSDDGTWMGHNTDAVGFLNSIRPFLRSDHERALVIGNGGAAKAVRYGLNTLGIQVAHVTRRELSGSSVRFEDLSPEAVGHHKLVVQCTPVGTYPDVDNCVPFPWSGMTPQHLVVDLVYNPAETKFLREARSRGAESMNGKDMLYAQADADWRWWTT
jgi:shikimate dehydrogenase